MSLLIEYGMFVLKALTIVFSFLLLFGGLIALSRKPKPKFEMISLNEKYHDIQAHMLKMTKRKPEKSKQKKDKNAIKPTMFVLEFIGDIKAMQGDELREEISAILSIATPKDEVLLKLESPGGTVNGYGLAASQLQRLRSKNIPLTVCIDKIATSGGYLMACVADKILAAPFAIVGSIGVVTQFPNFNRLLKKNDIDVELLTAGEYKRTLTMFSENTEKGREKFLEDLSKIHSTFKHHVLANRKNLNIEKVSTGEHWLANEAIDMHLVDQLKTSDEYLLEKINTHQLFTVKMHGKQSIISKLLNPAMKLLTLYP